MSSKDMPAATDGNPRTSNELYDDSKNINAELAEKETLFDDVSDYSPYGYSVFPMENELLSEPDVHPGLAPYSSKSLPAMSLHNVSEEDNNQIASKLLNDGMTYNSDMPFSSFMGISHGGVEIKPAFNPNSIHSNSYALEVEEINESSVLRNATIIPESSSFSGRDGTTPLHSTLLKDIDVCNDSSVDLFSKAFINIDCRSDDDNDSSANFSSHSSAGGSKKVQSSELELIVINTCKDILTGAIQQSLKAVELANTLRARLGTETMGQIREKCGGLLSLLERYHNMFRVQRIPKNDFVSLLSGGPNEIDNALQYIPAEAVSTSCLHVGNVPTTYNEDTLREEFELYGSVESVNIITQRNRRFAFVSFHSVENASQAKLMLSRKHPWKSAISFARKEHPSKTNSITTIATTTQHPSENATAKSENLQNKMSLNRATTSLQSSALFNSSINFDQLTQRESYSNYIRSHHEGESFSAPPFLNLRSKYTMMPYNSPTSNNRTKNSMDAATGYQPTTTTTTAMPYNYSGQLSMARSGSHSSSSSLSALFRSSQGGVNNPDNNLTTNRDRYLGQDKPPGLTQSQRTLSFHQIRNDPGNHRSEFSSIIPAYRSQTQRFDPAISRNINLSRSNSNSNSSSGNSLMGDFQVRGSYLTESVTGSLPSTTTKAFQSSSSSSSSYTTNNDSPSPHPPPRYEGRPPANETLNYENELQFIDSITSNHSNYLFIESQNKLQQKQQQHQQQQQEQQLSRAIDSTQLPPYTTSYNTNTNYLPAVSTADNLLRSLPRHIHSMSSSSENIESSYHYDTISINDNNNSNRLISEYESSPTVYSNNYYNNSLINQYIDDFQTNTVFNNRDHRIKATKSRGISNSFTQYTNDSNNNLTLKSTAFVNSTYALPDPTLQPLHKLNDRSFVNPRPWEVDTEEDLPYCELVQNILAEQGGASTILKITDTLSALFQCNIQLLAVKAMLESYPQYFALSGSRVNLVTNPSAIRK